MKINKHTIFILVTYIDIKKYSHISKLLFFILFNYEYNQISELMSKVSSSKTYIQESDNGEIDLYGIKFKRFGGNIIE